MTTIGNNLQQVRTRIDAACAAAGRSAADVSLLAVSKTFGPEAVRDAALAGQRCFGENYVQEAVEKMALVAAMHLPQALQWHCIGPLQSNKTRLVAAHFDWVHTVDRLKIAERLSDQRPADLAPLQVCIQVNVDGGPTKAGVPPEEAVALARAVARLPRLALRGVMAIPDAVEDFAAQCAVHERARSVWADVRAALASDGMQGWERVDTLSLGMTADLEAAVRAGSTMVRVGSGIFGGRHYPAST
ncbi:MULTISPECIES: YggS family pyridoxal phosphate-dependent enzyme [unclassified Acidovorax]|uniref:YggS family pyridoxal phosphate-dependent enzyme n=1 Tax=unclassified Acidovorax TaxID=2684926 RepID=UPI0028831873|nr:MULTISPECIES: YggS family pyridoxal phosphate-dependent enzyme [unclassified Acidovorax]